MGNEVAYQGVDARWSAGTDAEQLTDGNRLLVVVSLIYHRVDPDPAIPQPWHRFGFFSVEDVLAEVTVAAVRQHGDDDHVSIRDLDNSVNQVHIHGPGDEIVTGTFDIIIHSYNQTAKTRD